MIKIKITARNFTYGTKIFGSGGEYTVDENTARYIVSSGKGVVIEGILPESDKDTGERAINDGQFLTMVRRNATKIVAIIEEEIKAAREAEAKAEAEEIDEADLLSNINMTADLSVDKAVDNSENATTGAETASSSPSESADSQNASDIETDIPEGFPGREILLNAGLTKLADIPTTKEDLMAIEGIGARLANQIGVKQSQG